MPLTDRNTRRYRTLIRLIFVTGLSLSVFACGFKFNRGSTGTLEPVAAATPQLATRLLAEGETAQAAGVYEQLAGIETDPLLRQEYLLTATELYFDSELYNDGVRMFAALPPFPDSAPDNTASNIPTPGNTAPDNTTLNNSGLDNSTASTALQQRLQILTAYNALARGGHEQALQLLPPVRSIIDGNSRSRSLELQSRAYQTLSQPENALKARILLESNLTAPTAIALNRSKTAALLSNLDINGIRAMARTPGGSIYRGWLEYAALTKQQNTLAPEIFSQRSELWKARYPNHPAATINLTGTQVVGTDTSPIATNRIALLLPLTGRFSAIGDSIKTGFIAARFADGGTGSIKLYDTASDTATAINQYELATSEGASMIIGPLDKSAVINLTASNRITAPTLSLNYLGEEMTGNANLFQFGLLPEDEARDAAQYALAQNHRKAIVIASDSPISQRLGAAFESAFTEAGGRVLASDLIEADAYDYSQQLTKMLDINSSYSRKRRLEQLFETSIEFEPAIRGDIEVIFMAVDSEQALLLRPQLQFHHSGKLPLISTSQVFSGEPDADRDGDLTGIKYNDIPWTLTDANSDSDLYRSINVNHQDGIPKLIALGIDAYRLHSRLDRMRLDPSLSVIGKTGALSLAEGNRIRRRLDWAEFQEGVPVRISGALPVTTSLPPLQGEL